MIDLHLHLLPGVDDGAADLDAAVAMCRQADADGCRTLVATPHQRRDEWPSDPAAWRARLDELQAAVGPRPALVLGAEVRVDSELLDDLERPDRAGILTLAGSRYLLLEFEPLGVGPDPIDLVLELVRSGLRPIIAHPEVTPFLAGQPELVERLVDLGALLQVTGAGLTGDIGRPVRERSLAWIESGLVHFVASDAHGPDWRPPGLSRARAELARRFGEPVAQALTCDHAQQVIADRELAVPLAGDSE